MVILILETFFGGGHHFMPGIGRNQAEQRRVANEAFNLLEDGDADLKQTKIVIYWVLMKIELKTMLIW